MGAAPPVVTVDGPSGVGKGTVAHRLAARLGFHVLDSGALYRLLALAAERHGVDLDREVALAALAAEMDVEFEPAVPGEPVHARLDGRDVDEALRAESCGHRASVVAALPGVRTALLERQRAFRRAPGLVADGRDMGTVVFPDARLKFFLTATAAERARRRYKQLIAKGIGGSLADLLGEITERDRRDRERPVSPLKPAGDAVVIDTTELSVDAVFDRAWALVREHGLARGARED